MKKEKDKVPWRKFKWRSLIRLTDEARPARWCWRRDKVQGRPALLLVSPRGPRWQFKLNGGAWIRRI